MMDRLKEARLKSNKEINTRENLQYIGDKENSSPEILCAGNTAIADWYKKIAGLIIPLKALKKGRHAIHVCQQGTI